MRRRAARRETEKVQIIRIRLADVYGGILPERSGENPALHELADSIARRGLLQPVVVRKSAEKGRYVLVCGARRLAACRLLGMHEINAALIDADMQESAACFVEEHFLRSAPCAMEEAAAMKAAGDAEMIGSRELAVRMEMLRSLERLELKTEQVVRRYRLSPEQAYPLTLIENGARQQEAAMIIAERALTPAQARRLAVGSLPKRACEESGRKRIIKMALAEIQALARRLRVQGTDASVSVYSQEGGICIQILLQHGEKVNHWQENAEE